MENFSQTNVPECKVSHASYFDEGECTCCCNRIENACIVDSEERQRECTLIEFIINVIAFFIYFLCWLINFWFIIANISYGIIKYFYAAPRWIQIMTLTLIVLLILTSSMHLIIITHNQCANRNTNFKGLESSQQIEDSIIDKYIQYENLSSKNKMKTLEQLEPHEAKIFRIFDEIPAKLRSLIYGMKNLAKNSIDRIIKCLISTPDDQTTMLRIMSDNEKNIVNQLKMNSPTLRPKRFNIIVKNKIPYNEDPNSTDEILYKQFFLTITDKSNNKIYEEVAAVDVRREGDSVPALEMFLEKILIEDY